MIQSGAIEGSGSEFRTIQPRPFQGAAGHVDACKIGLSEVRLSQRRAAEVRPRQRGADGDAAIETGAYQVGAVHPDPADVRFLKPAAAEHYRIGKAIRQIGPGEVGGHEQHLSDIAAAETPVRQIDPLKAVDLKLDQPGARLRMFNSQHPLHGMSARDET